MNPSKPNAPRCPKRKVVSVTKDPSQHCLHRSITITLQCGHTQRRIFPTKADLKLKAGSFIQCGLCWRNPSP